MNASEREEFQLLKNRHAELRIEFATFGYRLDAFELRFANAPTTTLAPEPKVIVEPVIERTLEPVAAFIPPVIESIAQTLPREPAVEIPPFVPPVLPREILSSEPPIDPPDEKIPQSKPEKRPSFEMRLGTFWLVRIGIVMLLTSLTFFGNYAYQNFVPHLGPAGKISMLYLASGLLFGVGGWLQRKQDSLKNYAQVLQAGGMAAIYFTTYAAHHFANLQVIKSPVADGLLLLAWAGFIIWQADRKKSQVLAVFAVLLGYYTSVINHAGLFTLYSNLVLTLAAVFFMVRNRWATVSYASLIATYASYDFWRFFHAGQWQWADPGENLWIGNYFLIGYWVLFTAAAFLSRHEQFNGACRATFVSLNNGAFFSAFVLTMVQTQQGGFWKICLGYGSLLIVLSVLAQKFLAGDKLSRNTYLTQGLLLVTLGFLTRLAGLQLTLVLSVESVMLLILGRQFQSRVMQFGSLVTAGMATGWAAVTIAPFDFNGLLVGSSVGFMMLWNAFGLSREITYESSTHHLRTIYYTTLAALICLVTTWQNSHAEWRSLIVGIESAVALLAARPLRNQVLKYVSAVFAALAVGWETFNLADQFATLDLAHRTGLPTAICLGAILLANALWEKRDTKVQSHSTPSVTLFSSLSLLMWLVTTCVFTPREHLAPVLAIEALALTAACHILRLRTLPVFGQIYLLLGQILWLYDATISHTAHPWWNPATVIAATLLLAAWWPRQKFVKLESRLVFQLHVLHSLAIVGVLYYWLEPQFTAPSWLAFTSVLAISLTAYAAFNRFWLLAAAGQIFIIVSGWQFFHQLLFQSPAWYLPLVPVAVLCLLSFCAVKWFDQRPNAKAQLRKPILGLALGYRVLALVMSLWWIHQYIPARENIWFLALTGFVLFLIAGWRRKRELLMFGAVFTAVGLAQFWIASGPFAVYWPNLLAILALMTQQQLAQRFRESYQLPREIHATAMVIGSLTLWAYVSRAILLQASGFYLTAGWSVLALVLFIAGMLLTERVYRWIGLAVLAGALGRVVIFDVWTLEPLYRIFSFMALGIVLLVLGFLYNRYQDKINQWL